MDDGILLKDETNGVMTLTLNRPEIMNSLNFDMLRSLRDHIEAVRFNKDVRVVVITGAGEKAFCAGADLKERATMPPEKVKEFILTSRNLFTGSLEESDRFRHRFGRRLVCRRQRDADLRHRLRHRQYCPVPGLA